ncbi:MAG: twin-arginine translocase subunit TatC [Pirellulaceae bacterium]
MFEDTRMSFGEHLEELRKVLIKSLIAIAVGTGLGLLFSNQVLLLLQRPLNQAILKFEQQQAKDGLVKQFGYLPPEADAWLNEGQIPQKVLVDPAELVLGLRAVNPDFFDGINVQPYEFRENHFSQSSMKQIASKFFNKVEKPTVNDKQVQALLAEMPEARRRDLELLSKKSEWQANDIASFLAILNSLLDSKSLVNSSELESLFGTEQSLYDTAMGVKALPGLGGMREELAKKDDPILRRRLNRLLIRRIFRYEIPQMRMDLVPIVTWHEIDMRPQSLGITEPFMIWFKAGLITGLFLASPYVFYQLWSFVAAGLYRHEKRYVHIYLPISLLLFLSGLLLAYFFVFDPVLQFLFQFNAQAGIAPQPRINDWLGFVLFLPLGFGVAFQLPLVMLFMNRIGIFETKDYLSKWRIAVMIIFVISMVLTPADPISMLLMAIPLTILYFLGVGLCKWMPANRNPFADEPAPLV